ncbi:MAG: hypothetical protein J5803_03405 [Desulfovibrio sp.]|nr:hypothetical protein [Desulfovibrio sp.]
MQTHHIMYRSKGESDRTDNLITVCADSHTGVVHKKGGILYALQEKGKKVRKVKEPPLMNTLRRRLFFRYVCRVHIRVGYGACEERARTAEIALQ